MTGPALRISGTAVGLYAAKTLNGAGDIDWAIGPLPGRELIEALSARGIHSTDIRDAVDAENIDWDEIRRA